MVVPVSIELRPVVVEEQVQMVQRAQVVNLHSLVLVVRVEMGIKLISQGHLYIGREEEVEVLHQMPIEIVQ
jgi:hypothetical protein